MHHQQAAPRHSAIWAPGENTNRNPRTLLLQPPRFHCRFHSSDYSPKTTGVPLLPIAVIMLVTCLWQASRAATAISHEPIANFMSSWQLEAAL